MIVYGKCVFSLRQFWPLICTVDCRDVLKGCIILDSMFAASKTATALECCSHVALTDLCPALDPSACTIDNCENKLIGCRGCAWETEISNTLHFDCRFTAITFIGFTNKFEQHLDGSSSTCLEPGAHSRIHNQPRADMDTNT
jgi:hypothetical protein